ncbi:hypothetical protein [Methylophaga sp.]|uniref:hypothetical protein n=1 Tax=Methylophaga sp. TaxID=2024840 RepID=UPI003A90C729
MSKSQTFPKLRVVKIADSFLLSGQLLIKESVNDATLSYPAMVNLALSAELYLKSYIVEEGLIDVGSESGNTKRRDGFLSSSVSSHSLKKLYEKINETIKNDIDSVFSNNELSSEYSSLEEALERFSNAFINARYPYEKNSPVVFSTTRLEKIALFLKSTIDSLGEYRISDEVVTK